MCSYYVFDEKDEESDEESDEEEETASETKVDYTLYFWQGKHGQASFHHSYSFENTTKHKVEFGKIVCLLFFFFFSFDSFTNGLAEVQVRIPGHP